MGALFSSPQPRVGDGPADPLEGPNSSKEGVLHPFLHPLLLAGILVFGLFLGRDGGGGVMGTLGDFSFV